MKLLYKINLVGLVVLIAVGLAISVAGVSTISKVSYKLNQELMAREVENIVNLAKTGHDVLVKNGLDRVENYRRQAQLDVLAELVDYQYGKSGQLVITNSKKQVIRHNTLAVGSPVGIQNVQTMIDNKKGFIKFEASGENRFLAYQVFGQWDWLIVLSVTGKEMFAARDKFIKSVIIILLASLVLGSLIFIWFIRRVVRPILQLAEATTYVSEGKWDIDLPVSKGRDEVAQLSQAFQRMAERLAQMYGSLETNLEEIEASQQALKESEEKYRDLVHLLPLTVYEADINGQVIFANHNALETFKVTEEELAQGISIFDHIAPDDQYKVRGNMARVLDGEEIGLVEYNGLRKDKTSFFGIAATTAIFHEGQAVGIRGIFMDITERKTLENELMQAREFLDSILNNVADPIFVKDDNHRFLLLNDAFRSFMGSSRREIIGKTEYDFFENEEAEGLWEQDDLAFSSEQPQEKESTVTHNDGSQHVILTKKAVFKNNDGERLLVGSIKDITKRKKMEQELFKSRKLESIGVLAGGIAHDFNNILTAIIGNLSLAKMFIEEDNKAFERLTASEKASFRAKDLTMQLLTFSRGGAPIKHTVSLAKIIEDSAMFTLRGSKVRCELSLSSDLWPVDVDEGQISRVIQNMMLNASQAMPDGGIVEISAENQILSRTETLPLESGRYICIEVQDHGIGIPADIMSDIFDPYFTTKEMGCGLGLATSFSIIKRHDGYIVVESILGRGSIFKIYLPASPKSKASSPEAKDSLHQGKGHVLIMDDEVELQEVVSNMLELIGYTYESADHGADALEKYKKAKKNGNPFDVVIMDLTIPGAMGGQKAVKKLLEIDPDVKTIVSSGYSSDPVMSDYKAHGFVGMLTKPFELKKLSMVLKQVLSQP